MSQAAEIAFSEADWERLAQMRQGFLERATEANYWKSRRDLQLYEATFAQRIAWKWRAVLAELRGRGFVPQPGPVLDWACGTGVAARELLSPWPTGAAPLIHFHDRASLAEEFAKTRLLQVAPTARVTTGPVPETMEPSVLLISHALSELQPIHLAGLIELARRSLAVVWIEPGDHDTSRQLGAVRETLRQDLDLVGPCTHSEACGALTPENARNWCHFFAAPDPSVFRSAHWRSFSKELSIDLRSVPYSYIALCRKGTFTQASGCARVLGKPRLQKGRAMLDVCDQRGLRESMLLERLSKPHFKALESFDSRALVFRWEEAGGRVQSIFEGPEGKETA